MLMWSKIITSFYDKSFDQFLFSDSEENELSGAEADYLHIFIMRYFNDMLQTDFFPNVELLHDIAYTGVKFHRKPHCREICSEYLYKLIRVFPPKDEYFRWKYLDLFFNEIQDKKSRSFDISKAWDNFSFILEEYLSDSQSPGTPQLVSYLVKVLEMDFHFWMDM